MQSTVRRQVLGGGQIYLGAAFLSGLDKVVVPFFDRGIPVEYEVVRSITTVSPGGSGCRIGVVTTDARLFGGFDMQTMSSRPGEQIINELNKQYDTDQVNASGPDRRTSTTRCWSCSRRRCPRPSLLTPGRSARSRSRHA